jgi:hypothetical protein
MKTCVAASIGLLYSIILLLGGIALSGGGHYYLFLLLAASPYGFGFLFWPVIAALLLNVARGRNRLWILAMLCCHYIGIAVYCLTPNEWDHRFISHLAAYVFPADLNWVNWTCYAMGVVYAVGHVVIWTFVLRNGPRGI